MNHFERKTKSDQPILAICYDFDKTLTPDDMQAQGFIQEVGYDVDDFWKKSNDLAEQNDMDHNLAYMFMMITESEGKFSVNRKNLESYGAKVSLFPGVDTWFERIRAYGQTKNVIVEHYIISSGLKEMIEGTSVAKNGAFEKIYASSFYFNEKGAAKWPAQVVNFTNKTQFLFRIEKGVLDVNDPAVNEYFQPEEIRVPFRNMVYIGDSDTDIPCMKLVNSLGGHSIGVFNKDTQDKTKVYKMMRENRIKYYTPADYSEGSALDNLVKAIIDATAANEVLERNYCACKKENMEADRLYTEEGRKKIDLINSLVSSYSFANTHAVIDELQKIETWTMEEKEMLFEIALCNSQVKLILKDPDLRAFFSGLLKDLKTFTENAKAIMALLEQAG